MIDSVAERSHSYTIASPEIVGAVNNCIHAICGSKMSWSDFIHEHGSLIANFLQKMRDSNREKKIYQPGRYGDSEQKVMDELFSNFWIDTSHPPIPPTRTAKIGDNPNEVTLSADWNG